MDGVKDKPRVLTGSFAKNPSDDEPIPIWIAGYLLIFDWTEGIMGMPIHDNRDFKIAQKVGFPRQQVLSDLQNGTTLPFRAEWRIPVNLAC
jgi:leucyl-tRNA synthetase